MRGVRPAGARRRRPVRDRQRPALHHALLHARHRRPRGGDRAWEVALADAHRRGSLFGVSAVHGWLAATLHLRGDLADAEAMLARRTTSSSLGPRGDREPLHRRLPRATLIERGDLAGARTVLERARTRRRLRRSGSPRARRERAAARGGPPRRRPRRPAAPSTPPPAPHEPGGAAVGRAAGRGAGRARPARGGAPARGGGLARARAFGAPGPSPARCARSAAAQRADGLAALEEAAAAVEGSPAKLEHAKALAALGRALRLARRPTEAREPLRRALELATACGATPVAELARAELLATGARPRPPRSPAPAR